MRLLLDHGADLERTTDDDSAMRPLHFAAQTGDQLCVKELLLARADPTAANAEGQTPAVLAAAHPEVRRCSLVEPPAHPLARALDPSRPQPQPSLSP